MPSKDDFISDSEIDLLLESLEWFDELDEGKQASIRDIFYSLILKIQGLNDRLQNMEQTLSNLDAHMMAIYALLREKGEFH